MAGEQIAGRDTLDALPRAEKRVVIEGKTFILREMTGAERDALEAGQLEEKPQLDAQGEVVVDAKGYPVMRRTVNPAGMRARTIAACWVDAKGQRIFRDDEAPILASKLRSRDLDKLFEAAQELNAMAEGSLEAAVKNSAAAPSGASNSASPASSGTPAPTSSAA